MGIGAAVDDVPAVLLDEDTMLEKRFSAWARLSNTMAASSRG